MGLSSNFKYTFEKNKSKILIGSSAVLFAGIGVGVYFLFTDHDLFGRDEGKVLDVTHLAEYLVSGDQDGSLSLVEIKTGKTKDTVSLPSGTYLYTPSNGYDKLYAYDGNTVTSFELKKGKFVEQGEVAKLKVEGAIRFRADKSGVAVLSNNGQTLTYQYEKKGKLKTKEITVQDSIDDFHIDKGVLTYSSNTKLYAFSPTKETSIDLGETTDTITSYQDQLLIHNRFGSGLKNSILISLNPKNLKISELEETLSAETNLLPFDTDDQVFYTTQYVSSSKPYHLLNEWKIRDGHMVKEKNRMVKIPVKEDGIVYDHQTTVASDGYMYTHFNDRVQIFDIRSQEVSQNVNTDEYFAMPVLNR